MKLVSCRIYYIAHNAESRNSSYQFNEINDILETWYNRKHMTFDDFKEDEDYLITNSVCQIIVDLDNKKRSVDKQLEAKYDNIGKMNAGEKCIDRINKELHYADYNWAKNIIMHISTWNRQCNEIDNRRYGK